MDFINNDRYSPFANPEDIQNPWQGVDFAPQGTGNVAPAVTGLTPQPQTPPHSNMMPFEDRLRFLDQQGPAEKALQAHLEAMPKYAPNALTRIGAAMSGAGAGWFNPAEGGLVAQQMLKGPYQSQLNDWMARGKGLENAATTEDRNYRAKVGLLSSMDRAERESYTESRNAVNDKVRNDRMQAETKNYNSLVEARGQGFSFHTNATNGHLIGIKRDGTTQDFGVVALTPQQQADLKVNTFSREQGMRDTSAKSLFDYKEPKIEGREKNVHKANRLFDVANPLPSRAAGARDAYVSVQQQTGAIKQAAKELQIENPRGGYGRYINTDGTLKTPDDLGSWLSSASDDDIQGLEGFYQKVKERADQITSKKREPGSNSTAVASPKVKDTRIVEP